MEGETTTFSFACAPATFSVLLRKEFWRTKSWGKRGRLPLLGTSGVVAAVVAGVVVAEVVLGEATLLVGMFL